MKQQQLYYIIGRSETCDIQLFDDLVSREHATLRVGKGDKFYIMDHSTNGTYLNGMRLQSEVEYEIERGARVDFAHVETLDWDYVPKKKSGAGKIILITLCSIFLAAGLGLGIWYLVTNCTCDGSKKTEQIVEQEKPDSTKAETPTTVPVVTPQLPPKPEVTKAKETVKKPVATKPAEEPAKTNADEKAEEKAEVKAEEIASTPTSTTPHEEEEEPITPII